MSGPGTRTGVGNRALLLLQNDWSGGSRQDVAREKLPANAAWLLTDVFPDGQQISSAGFSLRARNGWVRTCTAMSATSSSYAAAVGVAQFSGGTRVLGIDEDGRLYKWTPVTTVPNPGSDGSSTNVGAAVVPAHAPVFYRNYAYIFDGAGSATGYRYDGTTLSNISGTPPTGSVGCVFKDHLVTAHSSAEVRRVWFASAGDPTSWDTGTNGQYLDCSSPVQGLATFQNMILAFQEGQTERLRGDVIPGVVGSDFVREPLFQVGCSDPSSIAVSDNFVVFANANGVYLTDGLLPYDLTAQCGMSNFWRNALTGYSSSYTIAAGLYQDWYVFSVMNGATPVTAGAIQVKRKQYVKFTNVNATMMAATPNGVADVSSRLFMAERAAPNITDLGSVFDTSVYTNKDGDGTVLTQKVETRFYQGSDYSPKRWRSLYTTGGDGVTTGGTVKYTKTSWADPSTVGTTLSTTHNLRGTPSRSRLDIGTVSRGMSFYITQTCSASDALTPSFHLDALEAEVEPLFGRRR